MQFVVEPVLLRFSQEDLAAAELVVVAVEVQSEQEISDVVLGAQKALREEDSIELYEFVVSEPNVETGPPNSHGLQHSRVSKLTLNGFAVKLVRYFVAVRFDAADEERVGLV